MRELDFKSLKERLLRGGVAPKHVRRAIAELQDHHTDLFAEALSRGRSVEEAGLEASLRLGDEDTLAAEIIARPELRSWAHRWPWVVYGLTPTVLFVAAFAGLFVLIGLAVGGRMPDYGTFSTRWGSPDAPMSLTGALRLFCMFGLPLLPGAVCCLLAGRRRAALGWPVVGVIMVSTIGSVYEIHACWPHGWDAAGGLCMAISVIPPFPNLGTTILRAAGTCALTLGPYFLWRRRAAISR